MEGIGHTRDQARRTTGEYGNITHQGAGNMGGDYSSNGTGTGVTTPLGGGGYGHEGQQQHHGGGFPIDAGAATAAYGGTDTTGAFPADIGATTGHGMTGIHAPDIGAGYAGSGTQGQLHHGGGVTDKIKDKLPGGHKDEQRASTTTAETYEGEHEKKGIMDKIKEKLPGPNN